MTGIMHCVDKVCDKCKRNDCTKLLAAFHYYFGYFVARWDARGSNKVHTNAVDCLTAWIWLEATLTSRLYGELLFIVWNMRFMRLCWAYRGEICHLLLFHPHRVLQICCKWLQNHEMRTPRPHRRRNAAACIMQHEVIRVLNEAAIKLCDKVATTKREQLQPRVLPLRSAFNEMCGKVLIRLIKVVKVLCRQ